MYTAHGHINTYIVYFPLIPFLLFFVFSVRVSTKSETFAKIFMLERVPFEEVDA